MILYGEEILLLFASPLLGLGMTYLINRRSIVYVLIVTCILLFPVVMGYEYIIPYSHRILLLVICSCIYALITKNIDGNWRKVARAFILSGILFVILAWLAFMDAFSGFQKVEQTWKVNDYLVEYVRDQGFAGGPAMSYRLSRYALVPILIKHHDTTFERDTVYGCTIPFESDNLVFDKCLMKIGSK